MVKKFKKGKFCPKKQKKMKVVFVAFKGKEGKYRTQCNLEYAVESIKIFLEIVEIMLLKK